MGDKAVSSIICTLFPENILPHVYYSFKGALKSAAYNLKEMLVGVKALESASSQWAYLFFDGQFFGDFVGIIAFTA